jgi:hypothetical protein
MSRIIVIAEVEDIARWEKGFRSHGDLFRSMGISRMEYTTSNGNLIAVSAETSNLDAYMKVFQSSATTEAMAVDGIKRETVKSFVLDKDLKV